MISFCLMFYLLHLCFFALFPKKSNKKKDWFISLYFYQENLSILIFESILPNLDCVLSIGYFVIYKKLIFRIFLDCNNISFIFIGSDFSDSLVLYIRHFVFCVNLTIRCRYIHISHLYSFNQDTSYITIYGNKKEDGKHIGSIFFIYYLLLIIHIIDKKIFIFHTNMLCDTSIHFIP